MNINHMETFLELAKSKSFTATAAVLHMTQPSVSRQIRQLEEDLGIQLFIRDRHHVDLTPEGRDLRGHITPLLEELRNSILKSKQRSQALGGSLSFGCLPEMGQYFFMGHLTKFRKAYPRINLNIQYQLEDKIVSDLKTGHVDFGILSNPLISESIRSYPLITERAVLVTRTRNQAKLTSIRKASFVGYNPNDLLLRTFLKRFYKVAELRDIKEFSTVNSHRSMVEFLLFTDSYAVLPTFSVREPIESGQLRIASKNEMKTQLYLVYPERDYELKRHQAFRQYLLDACRGEDGI